MKIAGSHLALFKKWYVSPFLFPFYILLLLTLTLTQSHAGERKSVKPSPRDKCPVCGMFVAKFPDWNAEIIFKDGSYAVFDGAKDMFKYYFDLKRYNPSKSPGDIDSIYVTDYYDLTLIDGTKAFYVSGSDVHGPMGRELIPFKEEGGAMDFLKDHKGKVVLKFREVTPGIVRGLDD
jgi:copper chaperone NosL